MNTEPQILHLSPRRLIGTHMTMSLTDNKTFDLWRSFMPRRKEIRQAMSPDLYSIQFYDPDYFEPFDPSRLFVKWAVMEVSDFSFIPADMETLNLPGGLYAVFHYKGLNTDPKIFEYIFSTWLPNSTYILDHRPHFEILGEKYMNHDPASEEEIWIPIKSR